MNIIKTRLSFGSLSYGNQPHTIVLHHADASHCTIKDVERWHKNRGWSGVGYHFFIDKKGQIFRGRPENTLGAHCKGHNTNSLGICCEGNYMTDVMPTVQQNAVINLCIYLKKKYTINRICGHKDLFPTACPGINFPLNSILQAIKGGNVIMPQTIKKVSKPEIQKEVPRYDGHIPTEGNIWRVLGMPAYLEWTKDGRLIIHRDRGNYITIGQGKITAYWNDNKGHGGNKIISKEDK